MGFLDTESAVEVIQGESKNLELHVTYQEDGTDFDLTSATIYFTVKCGLPEIEPTLQKVSTDSAQIEVDAIPTTGKATIHILSADTKAMNPGIYVFDVVVVSGADQYVVVGPSTFTVSRGVTRL